MRTFSAAISAFVFLQAQILNGTSFFSLFLIYTFNSSAVSLTVRRSLKNFTLAKGCLVIAGRAYGTIKSMEHCLAAGGDFIIRIKNKAFKSELACINERFIAR